MAAAAAEKAPPVERAGYVVASKGAPLEPYTWREDKPLGPNEVDIRVTVRRDVALAACFSAASAIAAAPPRSGETWCQVGAVCCVGVGVGAGLA